MSKVFTNTYYGPTPQIESAGTTAIDSQTQGTISKLVAQPNNDAYPSIDSNGKWKYVEKYRGPTTIVRRLPSTAFKIGYSRTYARTLAGDIFDDRFNAPELPLGWQWIIDSISVKQEKAGDMCVISISYIGEAIDVEPTPGSWTSKPEENQWELTFVPYTINPYAFAKNENKEDKSPKEDENEADTASRYNIETFFNNHKGVLSSFVYTNDQNKTKVLNRAEQAIATKVYKDVMCQWHYPVITHIQKKHTFLSEEGIHVVSPPIYPDEIGGVDHTYGLDAPELSGCPFTFKDNDGKELKWVKTDDRVDGQLNGNRFTYTRRSSWSGFYDPDVNFYGNDKFEHTKDGLLSTRWDLGEL